MLTLKPLLQGALHPRGSLDGHEGCAVGPGDRGSGAAGPMGGAPWRVTGLLIPFFVAFLL